MRKAIWKKSLALGLAFTMMFSMTGCGGKDGKKNSQEKNEDTKNMVFSSEDLDTGDIEGDPSSFIVSGDKVYFYTMKWPEYDGEGEESEETDTEDSTNEDTTEEADTSKEGEAEESDESKKSAEDTTSEDSVTAGDDSSDVATADEGSGEESNNNTTIYIYSMNKDASDITKLSEMEFDSNEYVEYMIVDKDEKITLITSSWDESGNSQNRFVLPVDANGEKGERVDITKLIDTGAETYVSKIIADDKGQLVVFTEQKIFILNSDYTKADTISTDNMYIECAAMTKDGKIVCGHSDDNGAVVQIVDTEAKKLGEKYEIGLSYFPGSDSLMNGSGEYDFYYKDDSGIFGYVLADKKSVKLLDFLASEINSNEVYSIIPLSADSMLGMGWNEQGTVLTRFAKVDPSQVADKETITYGSLWGVSDKVKTAAIEYNKTSDKYRIEFKDYSNAGEDAVSKMNADIIAGNVPDIIELTNLPVNQYVAKGVLEDLTPYYDKDSEVNKEDIIPSVEKAMEINGKLYYLSPGFSVSTLIAAKKDVGDKTGWTFDELKEALEKKGEGTRPFLTENKMEIFYNFMYSSVDDYIDWSTGKCRFDSDDFKSVLEISNQGENEETEYDEDSPSEPSLIKSGKVLLAGGGWLDTDYVQVYKKMFNDDITFIGYPCEDRQGSYFSFESQVGIYSKSEAKDGAWDFIRQLMKKDYQAKDMWGSMPTNKDAFEMYMKTKTTTKKYTDEYGTEVEPYESGWGWDDMEIKIGPMSADEEQLYRDLIDRTTKVTAYDDEIMEIIQDEVKNYFSGQKGLDETADIIQNRVTTYVNENR